MVILGIDPGYGTVGYGVIDHDRGKNKYLGHGAITTASGTPFPQRLAEIYEDMNTLLDTFEPDAVAVEQLFFNTNVTTGIQVGHARGVILLACAQKNVAIYEYTPLQVKQAVVGYGLAEKKQVISMVTSILKLPSPPKPDDTADAVAIALCHAQCAGSAMGKYFNQR